MTDRVRTLTVVLDRDMREDDVENIMHAIGMVRNVADVRLGEPVQSMDWVNRSVAFRKVRTLLWEYLISLEDVDLGRDS